jgi:uroporphyrinogen-III synthase
MPATLPDGGFDALVVTSANAVRCGGTILDRLRDLPAHAVGEATAAALREVGIEPVSVGTGGVEGLALPSGRLLHLCGDVHKTLPGDVVAVPVYRMVPTTEPLPDIAGAVVALHSPSAGSRLDELAGSERRTTLVAAISPAAARACGEGWQEVHSAAAPDDESLLALAAALCQSPPR